MFYYALSCFVNMYLSRFTFRRDVLSLFFRLDPSPHLCDERVETLDVKTETISTSSDMMFLLV